MAERAVDGERVGAELRLEPLRQHDLVDVAGGDVFLRGAHHPFEGIARHIRGDRQGRAFGVCRLRQRPIELPLDELDLGAGELVQRLEVLVAGDARVGDDEDPVPHVIEREHRVEQHEAGFVLVGRFGLQRHRLEPRRRVVAQVADGAAGEARQARHERRLEARHQLAQHRDERLVRLGRLARAVDDRLAAPRPEDEKRILAEKRVAADLLAAFNRLQQKRVVGVLRDLQERRDRRQQIGDDLLVDRDERTPLRQLLEFLERRDVHVSSLSLCARPRP